jgi:hypothetical protein
MMKRVLSIILFGLFLPAHLCAQDSYTRDSRYWLTFGFASSSLGPGFYGSVSYAYKNNVFFVRYLKGDEFRFNVEGHYDEPRQTLRELGLLYGRIYTKESLTMSFAGGIGIAEATDRGRLIQYNDYERIDISTVGIPFEATFRFAFGISAIGGSWAGNFNSKKFISSGVLQLSIGVF